MVKWYLHHLQLSIMDLSAIPQFSSGLSVPILPKHSMEALHCLMKFKPLNQFKNLLTKYILNQKVPQCHHLTHLHCCFILLSVENSKKESEKQGCLLNFLGETVSYS